MKWMPLIAVVVLSAGIGYRNAPAQAQVDPNSRNGATARAGSASSGPVILEWVPPALTQLQAQAAVKSSFTLDRTMLVAASGLLSDSESEARQAIGKLDGVSVHMLRFGDAGIPDEALVDLVRDAYHLRGWKHLVTTTSSRGPVRNGATYAWLVVDGAKVRGGVVLVETPKSLTLVTLAGNLSPMDLLHLRGHFGIPRFQGEEFLSAKDK